MRRGKKPFLRPSRRQEEPNMADVLAQMERLGRTYFVKTLSKTASQNRETEKTAVLSLPAHFVHENGDTIEEWVILRTHLSRGRSGRPWVVRLSVSEAGKAVICDGWYAFVTDNQLREGDSLIFVLQEEARSEFEVYTFHGSRPFPRQFARPFPSFPDWRDRVSGDEENSNNYSSFPSPLHHQTEHKKAFTSDIGEGETPPSRHSNPLENHRAHKKVFTSDIREGKTTPWQNAYDRQNGRVIPSFRKILTASNIGRYDRGPWSNSGQFEFPRRFIRTHGRRIQDSVKLQGIHEDSPTHILPCKRRLYNSLRVDFLVTGWSRFVRENGLKKGHELEFTLMADSYFVVRKVY